MDSSILIVLALVAGFAAMLIAASRAPAKGPDEKSKDPPPLKPAAPGATRASTNDDENGGALSPGAVRRQAIHALVGFGIAASAPKLLQSATPTRLFRLGPYWAVLVGDISRNTNVEYLYTLVLLARSGARAAAEPDLRGGARLIVTSEVNSLGPGLGGSHFFCAWSTDGHHNMGSSDEWADIDRFTERALAEAARRLNVEEPPNEINDKDR